ncbi:MAG: hypothetical protein ABJH98_16715 [Reichenbachiella sp.]|uniref:hypothetical protein n=1 Tax=Reichenbachiella sp. TaxID=2184521 RepID=UPI00329781FB
MSKFLIYIINIVILLGAGYWYYQRYKNGILSKHFWPALVYKVCCGILLGLLFHTFYEGGDTIRFYEDAERLSKLGFPQFYEAITRDLDDSWQVRAIYFVRMVAVLKLVTQADYWLLSAYFSMFSFFGSFYLVDKLVLWKSYLKTPALLSFLYFPSIMFWSSGLLKESLVFGALTFLLGVYLSWLSQRKFHFGHFTIGILSLIIIVIFKYYIAAVLLPLLVYLIGFHLPIWKKWEISGFWKKSSIIFASLSVPVFLFFSWLSPNLTYGKIWQVMQENHEAFMKLAPEGAVYTFNWFGNGLDVLVNVPYLWFSGLFRPVIGEVLTFPAVLSSLENFLLLAGMTLAGYTLVKHKIKWTPELLAILIYVSALSVFLTYSAPNFGTLARFKIYYVPLLLMLIVPKCTLFTFLERINSTFL